jgi:hemerythrin-like metal-binding protein
MGSGAGRFAVGVDSIDALHIECEAMIAQLASALESGGDATSALSDLQDHLERHFQHEESLMSASDFPPAGCHQREHASVLEVVAEVRRRYAGGEHDPAARLADALVEWLELHAGSMDAALAQWLNTAREEVRSHQSVA